MRLPLLFLVFSMLSPEARAWTFMRDPEGTALRLRSENPWKEGSYLPLALNTRNRSGIQAEELLHATTQGLRQWQTASGGAFSFDAWQGDDPSVFLLGAARDGLSTLTFASASGITLGADHAAYTRLQIDSASAEIVEVDIILNDLDFTFTTDPLAATYGQEGLLGQVLVLDDVITHELGHALGMDHAGLLSTTMFAWAWADQSHLGCDDQAGIQALYGVQGDSASIGGRVEGPDGEAVFGAQVTLLSRSSAQAVASILTEPDGSFHLTGLAPDMYHILVEPFRAGADGLSAYWADMDSDACGPGTPFSRTFLLDAGGGLQGLEIGAGQSLVLETLRVGCEDAIGTLSSGTGLEDAVSLPMDARGFAFVESLDTGSIERSYRFTSPGTGLDLRILAYSLFSPAWVHASLLDAEGVPVPGASDQSPTLADADTGYTLWDTRLQADLVPGASYILTLGADYLDSTLYPRGGQYLDTVPFAAVMASFDEAQPQDCPLATHSIPYVSPAGAPLREDLDGASEGRGGCDTGGTSGGGLVPTLLLSLLLFRRPAQASC